MEALYNSMAAPVALAALGGSSRCVAVDLETSSATISADYAMPFCARRAL